MNAVALLMTESEALACVDGLPLESIIQDGALQSRTEINLLIVDEYAEALCGGAVFPPVIVFHDGNTYWLVDGFHRLAAYGRAGIAQIRAEIHPGSKRDALLYAAGVNASHGVRRTHKDKRRAVRMLLSDPEWQVWSDSEIARRCAVSHPFVARLRAEHLETFQDRLERKIQAWRFGLHHEHGGYWECRSA